jgi:hypothetical protein
VTTHEVLVAARNRLERVGWQQYFSYDAGPNCALGHLRIVGGEDTYPSAAYHALKVAIGVEGPIGKWNDTKGRTKAEVLAAFDRASAATAPPPPDLQLSELVEAGEMVA